MKKTAPQISNSSPWQQNPRLDALHGAWVATAPLDTHQSTTVYKYIGLHHPTTALQIARASDENFATVVATPVQLCDA